MNYIKNKTNLLSKSKIQEIIKHDYNSDIPLDKIIILYDNYSYKIRTYLFKTNNDYVFVNDDDDELKEILRIEKDKMNFGIYETKSHLHIYIQGIQPEILIDKIIFKDIETLKNIINNLYDSIK